jgi:hypothetical protein
MHNSHRGTLQEQKRTYWQAGKFLLDIGSINEDNVCSSSKMAVKRREDQQSIDPGVVLDEEKNGPKSRHMLTTHLL